MATSNININTSSPEALRRWLTSVSEHDSIATRHVYLWHNSSDVNNLQMSYFTLIIRITVQSARFSDTRILLLITVWRCDITWTRSSSTLTSSWLRCQPILWLDSKKMKSEKINKWKGVCRGKVSSESAEMYYGLKLKSQISVFIYRSISIVLHAVAAELLHVRTDSGAWLQGFAPIQT